ncbi:MAG: rhomboid family intramembrane serine protease [Solirubrobacteraceae bacterium]|nr:MAG: rhomboid family intramembrane serine protease [Solirubrobacterales bacterium]
MCAALAEPSPTATTRWARSARADAFRIVGAMLALMWIVEIIDAIDSHRLDSNGIVPRSVSHLPGIFFAPFLHAGFGHLLGNTVPFAILGAVIAFEGARRLLTVTAIAIVVSGLGTWLVASGSSVTIGASGVVFGYAAYLVARGVFNRRIGQLAIGAVVGVIFGATLLWDLIPHAGISWQDHLFGAIAGILAARLLAPERAGRRARKAVGPAEPTT